MNRHIFERFGFASRFRHGCGQSTESYHGPETETWERDEYDPRSCAGSRRDRFDPRSEHQGRHGFGRGFGGHGPGDFEGGSPRGRGRMFDAGDLKLVILKLLSEQPSYGYQLIKSMEERFAGGYTPSPGVIYPTLTLLEEEDLAAVSTKDGKKVYSVTPAGLKFLEENKERVDDVFNRIDEAGKHFERRRSPELMKAFFNLRVSVISRMSRGNPTKEQIRKIVDAINAAAKTIDES
jgi:DNA-binding PadR family transcriptional regulator